MSEHERIARSAAALGDLARDCRVGLVLGSGLKRFGAEVEDAVEVGFAEVPDWPVPKVEGHGGSVVFGKVEAVPVACLTGRVHLYEGWSPAEVVRAVRTLRFAGVPEFLLTNAAGGIDPTFEVGDLMIIDDHLNLTGQSPLTGAHEDQLGPRFPDQSEVYSRELRARLHDVDAALQHGVYAGMSGPSYETPAEVRMLDALGASAVGMSTVHEAIALNAMGARVGAVSLISNAAAGISGERLAHDEVIAAGDQAATRMTALLRGFLRGL